MKTTKKITVFLILVLMINIFAASAYAELKGKEIKLSENTIVVSINYQRGDDLWANDTLSLFIDTLQQMENISGVPYPAGANDNPYATEEEKKVNIKICELTDRIKECEGGVGIGKTQDITTTIRQIASIWNANDFEKDWLSQGHTSIYTYILLKEINLTEAEKFKTLLLLNYDNLDLDFPLDEWSLLESATSERQINKRNHGIGKSFAFMYVVYTNYGSREIADARKILNKNEIKPDSLEYKKTLENATNRNLDDLFSGWVFPGEYKIQPDEIKKTRIAVQKYNEVLLIYNKSQNKELCDELSILRTELYEKGDIEKSIEYAGELIDKYKDIDIALQKYNEVLLACNKSLDTELCEGVLTLHAELYERCDIKRSIEYADELIKNYNESSKNETKVQLGNIIEESLMDVGRNKYEETRKLYENGGIFVKTGLIFYDAKTNLDKAKIELDNSNFAASIMYSDRAGSDLEKAGYLGMVTIAAILIVLAVLLMVLFMKR